MKLSKSVGCLFAVAACAGIAGWCIPELYDSTGLDQSSTVESDVLLRAVAASSLVFLAVTIGWFVWRRRARNRQFGLRTVFAVTTVIAMVSCSWLAFQEQAEIRLVGFYVVMVLVGMLTGRLTFSASSEIPRGECNGQGRAVSKTGWRLLLTGIAFVLAQLVVCWGFEFQHGFAGVVWLVIFGAVLRQGKHALRWGVACYLAALFLPYVWLVRTSQGLEDPLALFAFLPAAPGIAPAAMVQWTPDSLLLPTLFLVLESLIGFWAACRSPISIGWLSGLACSASLFSSFGLHAMFRA